MTDPRAPTPLQGDLSGLLRQILERAAVARREGLVDAITTAECPICRGARHRFLTRGALAAVEACPCTSNCRHCHGRGGTPVRDGRGYETWVPCECQRLPERIALYNAAQLPARFLGKSFDDFLPPPGAENALKRAWNHLREFSRTASASGGFGLVLAGPPGTGKTHLLCATLAALTFERSVPCRFVEMSLLFADHKAAIGDARLRGGLDRIEELASIPILAIDELGKGRASQFELELLDELVSRRYNAGRTTLFATNHPTELPAAPAAPVNARASAPLTETLLDRVGPRVYSRLQDRTLFFEFFAADDYRRKLRGSAGRGF